MKKFLKKYWWGVALLAGVVLWKISEETAKGSTGPLNSLTTAQRNKVNELNSIYAHGVVTKSSTDSVYYTADDPTVKTLVAILPDGSNAPKFTVVISADGYVNGNLPAL